MHIIPEAAAPGHPSCPRCHTPLRIVNVHGHDQCVVCKSNIRECCEGEICQADGQADGQADDQPEDPSE